MTTPKLTTATLEKKETKKDAEPVKGRRYNEGKLRYDLVPTLAQREYVKVLTYGANKYTVKDEEGNVLSHGDDNWRNGLEWRGVIASMKRHIEAWERGEDRDFDKNCDGCKTGFCMKHSGCLHTAHMMCNAAFLTEYYFIQQKLDNRKHPWKNMPKVGLDIDEVLADWVTPWINHFKLPRPTSWFFDRQIIKRFEQMRAEGTLDDFYLNLPPKVDGSQLPFEPTCYITSRPVDTDITEQWLEKHGFPAKPVHTVAVGDSKIEIAKKAGLEFFVDDRFENFVEFNKAGIVCYLFDAPHNQRYNVGAYRIKSLNELPFLQYV